jgi:UDP-N-acetylglucosamine--N-acetylmuramyl-(pentapeptide) pyrophosphoryl-undecaprenol N-acetylglucosamine transferase
VTTYLLAGGGTAGHVNPLLAVADRIRLREPDSTILVLGTREGLEARLVPARGYELLTIERLPFPRRINRTALSFPARFRSAVADTRRYIEDRGVDIVVGFGGYASAPAYVAAARSTIPIALHEGNAKPGFANRLGARFATRVGVAFRSTRLRRAEWVGMPLRLEIERLDRHSARAAAFEEFGLDSTKPTLLVTGGSTGARSLNSTISRAIALIVGAGWQVLHITGTRSGVTDPGLGGYRILPYCDRMDLAIAVADFAVSRAGSTTVCEFEAIGVPAVFVPYPVGNGEQRFNARDAIAVGGALLVADASFTPEWVSSDLVPLLRNRAAISGMSARIMGIGARDGADRMVDLIAQALGSPSAEPARD